MLHLKLMKSYESSTATLRALLAHPSLQRDKVEETMDALQNANADARDIYDAIRVGGDIMLNEAGVQLDDDELEAELESLAHAEREKEEMVRIESKQSERVAADSPQALQAHAVEERPLSERVAEAA
jgi:charged multivesicular body protein 7